MDRLACISLPAFPLQVALGRLPPGRGSPLAVVKEDRPTSPIVHLNRAARDQGLRVGMRYSQALSVVCDLKAVTVSAGDLAAARQEVLEVLVRWSPRVEACPFDPASFWAGAGGLSGLYGTEAQWGSSIRSALADLGYRAVVVVGLTREGTYVLGRTRRRSTVVLTPGAERRALEQAPLSVFPLSGRSRRLLEKLGLTTLASVLKLPAEDLAIRFGPDLVQDLRALEAWKDLPIQAIPVPGAPVRVLRPGFPVSDRQALVPLVAPALENLLSELRRRARRLTTLRLVLRLESGDQVSQVIRTAEPTTDGAQVLRLLDLRLAHCPLPTAVTEIRLAFEDEAQPAALGELFAPPTVRDLTRGAEALALVRARWGNEAVVRAVLADSHVPEQSYRWAEVDRLTPARPGVPGARFPTAVRRLPGKAGPSGGNPAGKRLGSFCRLQSTATGTAIDRDYWFLRLSRGEVAWVSWDRLHQETRCEGMVD